MRDPVLALLTLSELCHAEEHSMGPGEPSAPWREGGTLVPASPRVTVKKLLPLRVPVLVLSPVTLPTAADRSLELPALQDAGVRGTGVLSLAFTTVTDTLGAAGNRNARGLAPCRGAGPGHGAPPVMSSGAQNRPAPLPAAQTGARTPLRAVTGGGAAVREPARGSGTVLAAGRLRGG